MNIQIGYQVGAWTYESGVQITFKDNISVYQNNPCLLGKYIEYRKNDSLLLAYRELFSPLSFKLVHVFYWSKKIAFI